MQETKLRGGSVFAKVAALCAGLSIGAAALAAGPMPQVSLKTNMGEIVLELDQEKAPKSVDNFLQYVKSDFYKGTIFHRVIDGFMIQGGGFDAKMAQKPTRAPIQNEAKNGLPNARYSVAMARTGDPNSATAQFFINVKDNAFLDPTVIPPGDPVPRFEYQGRVYEDVPRAQLMAAPQLYGYTVFGRVASGMDVVNKIKSMPTGAGGPFGSDVPKTPVVITSARLVH
jgi:peptidyl-prolyl cis-trans isomerase A (cyclophilin A)